MNRSAQKDLMQRLMSVTQGENQQSSTSQAIQMLEQAYDEKLLEDEMQKAIELLTSLAEAQVVLALKAGS